MKVAALHRSWTGNTLKSLLFVLYSVPFLHADLLVAGSCEDSGYPDQFSFACGENASMQWNADNSATDLGATATRTISILGGGGPYTWTVSGNGFYLDSAYTKKSITTGIPSTTLYTNNACGAGAITITDSCGSTVQETVRSSNGKWIRVSQRPGGMNNPPVKGNCSSDYVGNGNQWIVTSGAVRITQNMVAEWVPPAAYNTPVKAYAACMSLYNAKRTAMVEKCLLPSMPCGQAFDGPEYTPCRQLPPGEWTHYDSTITEHCDQPVFAYYALSGSWWFTKAHQWEVIYSYVDEWQCGN